MQKFPPRIFFETSDAVFGKFKFDKLKFFAFFNFFSSLWMLSTFLYHSLSIWLVIQVFAFAKKKQEVE